MIKPSETITKALYQLENNAAWKEFIEWVEESLVTQSITNNHCSGEETIKMQGRNLELEQILKHTRNSSKYIKNLKEQ